jgi:hypothetical protein
MKIYKQKVFVHHYTEFMEIEHFDHCLENCTGVVESYREMEEKYMGSSHWMDDDSYIDTYRFKPLI